MIAANSDQQDAQDMVRLAAGNDSVLDDLMERYGEKLFRYLVRSLQNEEDAADLAQETFVKVYQNRGRYDPKQKFSTWIYAIASNLVRDRYRWRARHPQVSLEAENEASNGSFRDRLTEHRLSPNDSLQAEERAEAVRRAVADLPDELRMPLILSEYEERSHLEIGEILGCSTKAVEMRIYRARQKLRSALSELLQVV
jgi:RNA polymerase sigma-70 factor, ECF subfamily